MDEQIYLKQAKKAAQETLAPQVNGTPLYAAQATLNGAQALSGAQGGQSSGAAANANLTPPAPTQRVTYLDSAGNRRMGVAADTNPDAPSTAETEPAAPSYYDTMIEGYQRMLDDTIRYNEEAARRAEEQLRQQNEANLAALAAGQQGTNRQLYRDYMENRRTLPQRMAARGYTGGLSESGQIRLANSYGEALAENARTLSQQEAQERANLAQALYNVGESQAARDQEARMQHLSYLAALEAQRHGEDYAREQTLDQREYQERIAHAEMLASIGDFSGYLELGFTEEEIEELRKAWKKNHTAARASYGGYSTGGNTGGGLQSEINAAAAEGYSPIAISRTLPDGNYTVQIPLVGGGGTVNYVRDGDTGRFVS